MKNFFRNYFLLVLCLVILVPRVVLLFNGLDSQRIWDTNTPAAFRFLDAVREHKLMNFFESGQKYPLLGSYLHIPVVGLYYMSNLLLHNYTSANDFINLYALNETNLFFWIRLSMFLMNIAALAVLYFLTRRFFNRSTKAANYILILMALNFYVTLFSVTPRIHNFAFFGCVLTLYASFLLLEKKTWWNYLAAFGTAIFSASVSQSGFTTLTLPVIAHFYNTENSCFNWRINKKIVFSGLGFLVITALLGYPRSIVWLVNPAVRLYSKVLLGDSHILPGLAVPSMPFMYLLATEFATVWIAFSGLAVAFFKRSERLINLSKEERLTLVHTVVFFAVFGFSNIFSGRFMLAVMPSLFFLLVGIWRRLESYRLFVIPLYFFLVIQAYGILQLTRVAFNGDTRAEAAFEMLSLNLTNRKVISTIDPVLLGITPSPNAVQKIPISERGMNESLIVSRNLIGVKSRDITLWVPDQTIISDAELQSYDYAVVSWSDTNAAETEKRLTKNNFHIYKTFFASRSEKLNNSFIPWDFITPIPSIPTPFALSRFRVFGPTVAIYKKS